MLAGQVMVGACASVTVTVNEQTILLLLGSVVFQVTVFTPSGKAAPLAKPPVWVSVDEQLSPAMMV